MAVTASSSSLLAKKRAGKDREVEAATTSEKREGTNAYNVVLRRLPTLRVHTHHLRVRVTQTPHLHQWTLGRKKGGEGRCHLRNTLLNDRITINVEMSNMELRTPILPNRMAFLYINKLTFTFFLLHI